MDITEQDTANTFESVWALIKANERKADKQHENFLKEMKISSEKFDREMAVLKEERAETDRLMKETARQMKETDRQFKETDRQFKETDRKFKDMHKLFGSWATNHGSFAEEYFFNSFENGQKNFFGENFHEIRNKIKNIIKINGVRIEDEYDIVLYNDVSIAIIEVKYKAHKNDIPGVLKKAETFKLLCPGYDDFKIYLGLASMSFYPELESECINQGIAIIKQVGDTVVINDQKLKVF